MINLLRKDVNHKLSTLTVSCELSTYTLKET